MSLNNWLYTPFAMWSCRSKKRGKALPRRPLLRLEVLEDRVVPDSGGAAGVLTSAGNLVLNPNNLNTTGFTQVIPNVKIQLIFLTDPNNGSPLSVPAATQTALKNFFTTITSDQYIPNLLSQYGGILGLPAIGTGSVGVVDTGASVNADTTVSGHRAYSSGNLTSIIQAEINNGDTAAADGLNNVYFIFTPPTDAVVQGSGNSTQNFISFHSSFLDNGNGKRDYYAVIPDQSSVNLNVFGSGSTNGLRGETMACSHEMSEAITDDVLPRGWANPTLLGSGEVGDLAVEEVYVHDGHEVQYEWSNAIVGAAHAPSSGAADLFINQLTPPAVPVSTSTSIPVATFTTANTGLTAGSFSAIVFSYDTTGHGHVNWTVTSITGGNGHFVVNAEPNSAVTTGTYGTTFAQAEGLYVDVLDNSAADATAVDGGIPIAQTYAPYVVSASSPLTYTTDAGTHNLVLKENGANFELRDNGNLVFTQPVALTTSIVIDGDGDPAGVDNSLTLDYSGGVFNTVPVTFDGGNGAGTHAVTVTGAALTSLTYDATAAGTGDFVVNGNTANKIAFTNARMANDSAATGTVTLNVDPNNVISGLVNTTFTGSGANSTATLDNGLPSFTFGNPTVTLVVTGHTTDDSITFASLGSGFNAALTVAGNGGSDTVNLNTALALGSGTSNGNVSITAATINLDAVTITTANGALTMNGNVTLTTNVAIGYGGANGLQLTGSTLSLGSNQLTLTDSASTDTGSISSQVTGTGSLIKGGSGTLTLLSAGNSYSGTTTVNAGTLLVDGSTASASAVTVADGATLGGSGTIGGAVSVSGAVAPGDSIGILSTGSVIFAGNATFAVGVGGTTAGNGGNHYDQLNVTGTVTIGSAVALNLSALGGFVPAVGESFTIIDNTGSGVLSGTFSGLAEGATIGNFLGSGLTAVITYAGGVHHNDVILTVHASTQTSLTTSVNPSTFGLSVTFTATVTSAGGTPTGSVTFMDGSTTLGAGTLDSSGVASFSTSGLSVASHSITAIYGDNGNFLGSTSSAISQVVNEAGTSTSLTSSVNPSTFGQSVTFTATVTSSGGTPTGTVTFMDGSTTLGTGTLDSNGVANFSTSNLSVATHSITAVYSDNGNFLGSTSSAISQVVNEAGTSTSLTSSLNPSTFGDLVTFTATVTSSGGTPMGTVTFVDGVSTLGTGTLDSSGTATFSTSSLSVASHSIAAVFSSSDNSFTASSDSLTQTVARSTPAVNLVSSASPVAIGKAVTLTATVVGAGGNAQAPTGTVQFYRNSVAVGSPVPLVNGQATLSYPKGLYPLPRHLRETYTFTAAYSGNADYTSGTGTLALSVLPATTTTVRPSNVAAFLSAGSVSQYVAVYGQVVSITATVKATPATGVQAGQAQFYVDGQAQGQPINVSAGKATLQLIGLGMGTHSVSVTYSDSTGTFIGSSGLLPAPLVITTAPTSTTLAASASTVPAGNSVTFSATVIPPAADTTIPPSGSVRFVIDGTTVATIDLDTNANPLKKNVSFSTSSLSVGTHTIIAYYDGATGFGISHSVTLTLVVTPGEG